MTTPDFAVAPEPLARRPSSVLYRARRADGLPVVLKVAARDASGHDEALRLTREDAIVRRLGAEHVVVTHGVVQHDGTSALVREDFGGRSLDAIARGAPLELASVLRVGAAVARDLAGIHAKGVVHRDVKPSNILANADGSCVKLTDFGVATAPWVDLVAEESFVGTLAYVAPEQTGRMHRIVDHRADLYAAGVTFYELLTGSRPFEARDPLEWIHFHLARKPRPPSSLRPDLPPVVDRLLMTLLAKAPEDRYQTARGLAVDLERCLEALTRDGIVADFPLRSADVPETFQIAQRLHGRGEDVAALTAAFAASRAATSPVLVRVGGYSGIGKSSVVAELHPHVAGAGGFFASGKFDQLRRHVPYSAFASAIRQLVDQLLSASGERLAAWQATLDEALGASSGVVAEVFPDLRRVLPDAAEPPPLGPAETQARFQLAFRRFLGAVATPEHPLVLFLDDLQWADPASLALVQAVAETRPLGAVLMVLAFRDNEVGPAHPFALTTARLREAGARIVELTLGPLDETSVRAIVATTLHASEADAAPLARVVAEKTAGNPFFVNEFLRTLYLDGLLRFDVVAGRWTWQQTDVEERSLTDNVVDLMVERLAKLPEDTREVLRTASCIGCGFGLDTLALVVSKAPDATAHLLAPAVLAGLIVGRREGGRTRYAFRHDRIQQAAFALVTDAERPGLHLRIARHLATGLSPSVLDANLFDVVNHYDEAVELVIDPAERVAVRVLNEAAGRKARAATAYRQARFYLATATSLLEANAWSVRYDEVFALERDLAECEYLDGRLAEAKARFEALLAAARSDLDRAQVYYLQMRLLQLAGDYAGAVDVALRSFVDFGLDPPSPEGAAAACAAEDAEADRLLEGTKAVEDLLDAPRLEDPRLRALADLLESSGPPLYMVRPELFPWITLKLLVLSLRHGNCEASCYAYGIYALMRAAVKGDVEGGYAFSLLALRLNEKLGDVRLRGCMLHLLGDHVNFWKNHVATDLPVLDRGFQACLEGGDLIYSTYIAFQAPWHAYEAGLPLDEVLRLTSTYLPFAERTNAAVHRTIRFEAQFVRALKGLTAERGSFADGTFDVEEAWSTITSARFGCGIVYRHILDLVAAYTFGDVDAAAGAAARAEAEIGAAFSMPIAVSFQLYRGLVAAALADRATGDAREAHVRTLAGDAIQLRRWATSCPVNFADKAALLEAELARVTGRGVDAMRSYDEAVRAARASGFVQYEALASELAGRFYLASGAHAVGASLLADAEALYRRWGAVGKASQLAEQWPQLRDAKALRSPRSTRHGGTSSTASDGATFDLLPVVKAAQSLSEEMVLSRLLDRLMSIVIEYAGAERGVLHLVEGGVTTAAASACLDARAADDVLGAPMTVVQHVQETGQRVILDDASRPNPFSSDPYVAQRKPRSVLCVPIHRRHQLTGTFYLENNLVTGAFSPERLAVLDVLASQTAISLDNARLFEASQAAVAARDEFLSLASHELKTPLTPLRLRLESLALAIREGRIAQIPESRLLALAQSIDVQLARMGHLVDTLLDASRVGASEIALRRTEVDLKAVAEDVVARHAAELARAGCATTVVAPAAVVGQWDRTSLELVVASLLTNALRHAPGAPIEITVTVHAGAARLSVQDHGPGFGTGEASKLFDRFTQGAGHAPGGLGLGLHLVRHRVAAHGGSIHVESAVGRGAKFVVELPLRTSPVTSPDNEARAEGT